MADADVPDVVEVVNDKDEGTIDILGSILAVEIGIALDNTVVGLICIGSECGAVIIRVVVGIEFAEDCNKVRFRMAAEGGGLC